MLNLCGEKGITCDVEVRWQRCVSVLVAPSVCHCKNTGMRVSAIIASILGWSCLRYHISPSRCIGKGSASCQ